MTSLNQTQFKHQSYLDLEIETGDVIYCDPPYKDTTCDYPVASFDHTEFWKWCEEAAAQGADIFISEFTAPINTICFWEKETATQTRHSTKKTKVERLFHIPARIKEVSPSMRDYPRLSIEEFGHTLLDSKDIDPVYDALNAMEWAGGEAQRDQWLLAYLLCYHPGAACYLSQWGSEDFWDLLETAAENTRLSPLGERWPRAPERRHWRGKNAMLSIDYISGRYGDASSFINYCAGGSDGWSNPEPYANVAKRVKEHYAFGDWISYKVADMLERCCGVPVEFTPADAMYDSPRKAAERVYVERAGYTIKNTRLKNPDAAVSVVVNHLLDTFGHHEAPGGGRCFGLQEAETVLCKWQSHMNGHYPLYNDLREIRAGIEPWTKVSQTARQFLDVFPRVPV